MKFYIRIAIISPGVIFTLILFAFGSNKIILIKDTSNKKLLVKLINYLYFPKMKFNLDIENTHFCVIHNNDTRLYIINDYKNLLGIDLNESNIKQKPAKFLYSFTNISTGNYTSEQFTKVLNNFIDSDDDNYSNPLFFNINAYLNKSQTTFNLSQPLSKYMKFSDHFFTYHFKYPLDPFTCDFIYTLLAIILNVFAIIGIVCLMGEVKTIFPAIIYLIFNIIIYTIYKIFKYCLYNSFRIDCIYSKNFDQVFIGIVKYTQTKYLNIFECQMNNISRFILEREGNISNSNFNLKVVFKNDETQQICTIKNKTQEDLEGLAYLLNERLNNNSNNNIDSNEQLLV